MVLTSSSQSAALVRNFFERCVDLIVPRALALPPPTMVDAGSRAVTLTAAWISVKELQFKTEETVQSGEVQEIALTGPYFVDLLSATPSAIGNVSLIGQTYRRIEMKLNNQGTPPASAPAGLNGNSIYLEGTVAGNSFSFSSQDGAELTLSGPNGFQPLSNDSIVVLFKFADLIKKTNMGAITNGVAISESNRISSNGACPTIDASANDLYTCIRHGLESLANAGVDKDGNYDLNGSDDTLHN
jgi:hypothetical protein